MWYPSTKSLKTKIHQLDHVHKDHDHDLFFPFNIFELNYLIGLERSYLEKVQVSFIVSYELIRLDGC